MRLFTNAERRALQLLFLLLAIGVFFRAAHTKGVINFDSKRAETQDEFDNGFKAYLASLDSLFDVENGQLPVNINSADERQLRLVSGIGPSLAKKIIAYRNKNGYFTDVEDLKKIGGIGSGLIKRWDGQLICIIDSLISQ